MYLVTVFDKEKQQQRTVLTILHLIRCDCLDTI